ncbi:hypothetical protein ASG41_16215 [Modestobacter sp. Leaf380]|nr:hypothetical protein ASG41_16215 [Modestobacter sp. Leaf380]
MTPVEWAFAPVVSTWFLGQYLLTGQALGLSGRAGAIAVAGYSALVVLTVVVLTSVPAARRRGASGHAVERALRRHEDPGPGLRERADRQAHHAAAFGWGAWLFPVALVCFLAAGVLQRPWPAVVVGGLLMTASTVVATRWLRGRAADARRWLADPPGPPRAAPVAGWGFRWASGRRGGALVAVVVLVVVLVVIALGAGTALLVS